MPARPELLASRDGTPNSSSIRRLAVVASGQASLGPGAASSNGNGTSEPISTIGWNRGSPWSIWATNTIGGMPTPPPMATTRRRDGSNSKPLPIGASTLTRSPATLAASRPSPVPIGRYRNSSQPASASVAMIESGRRSGTDSSQRMWAKLPGFAARAASGACTLRMSWSPGWRDCARTSLSLRKMVSLLVTGPPSCGTRIVASGPAE